MDDLQRCWKSKSTDYRPRDKDYRPHCHFGSGVLAQPWQRRTHGRKSRLWVGPLKGPEALEVYSKCMHQAKQWKAAFGSELVAMPKEELGGKMTDNPKRCLGYVFLEAVLLTISIYGSYNVEGKTLCFPGQHARARFDAATSKTSRCFGTART